MLGDLEITDGPVRLRVEGWRKTLRALEDAGVASTDMRDLMHALGTIVADDAKGRAPKESGKLAGTLRAGRGKTKAVIRAGSRAVPYAGIVHYGTPATYPKHYDAQPYVVDALQATQARVMAALLDGLEDLLRKANLK